MIINNIQLLKTEETYTCLDNKMKCNFYHNYIKPDINDYNDQKYRGHTSFLLFAANYLFRDLDQFIISHTDIYFWLLKNSKNNLEKLFYEKKIIFLFYNDQHFTLSILDCTLISPVLTTYDSIYKPEKKSSLGDILSLFLGKKIKEDLYFKENLQKDDYSCCYFVVAFLDLLSSNETSIKKKKLKSIFKSDNYDGYMTEIQNSRKKIIDAVNNNLIN